MYEFEKNLEREPTQVVGRKHPNPRFQSQVLFNSSVTYTLDVRNYKNNPKFTVRWWSDSREHLGIKLRFKMTTHPQTDEQSERMTSHI